MTKLTDQELFHYCEQFSIILRSGISAIDGLSLLLEDSKSDHSRNIFAALLHDMEQNGSLALALKNSELFPDTMVSYIKIGEETGCLDEIMEHLANHYEQEAEISQQIKSAVSYPLVMLGMMGAVILILLLKVLPVFQQVFRQMGMEMNGISQNLLNAGNVMRRYSVMFLVIAGLLAVFLIFLLCTSRGKKLTFRSISHIPYLKEIPLCRDYGRLTQGLALGLRSGFGPNSSMELAKGLVSHSQIKERIEKACSLMEEGELFVDALTQSQLFHGMDARLISIGFQAGAADEVMSKLSRRYQETSMDLVSRAVSILEPTIVILLSLLVGVVLLSVMMPLLGLLSQMI